ncbi:MAG TPA: hypothetical protein VE987_22805 [Polyangiaceae bacterium]|nr:hypothetical protein [Polyangiaceae bacterium]
MLFDLTSLDRGTAAGSADGADPSAASDGPGGVAPSDGAGPDAPADAPPPDAGRAIDSGGPADAPGADAREASTADAPAEAAAVDASADGGCTTAYSVVSGRVLFAFNTGDVLGWTTTPSAGPPSTALGWTGADGKSCPGALTMTVGFNAYGGNGATAQFTYGGPGASWGSASRLHLWMKLQPLDDAGAGDFAALATVELFVLSNTWANYSFASGTIYPTFADGAWHELVLDVVGADSGQPGRSGPDVVTSSIQQFGVSITPASARPSGAPPAPPTTVVLVDDIWLE